MVSWDIKKQKKMLINEKKIMSRFEPKKNGYYSYMTNVSLLGDESDIT